MFQNLTRNIMDAFKELPEDLFEGQSLTIGERKDNLLAICDSYGTEEYQKKFTEKDKARFKEELADTSVELSQMKDQLKAIVDEHKEEMKPLVEREKELVVKLKTGSVWVNETVYRIVNEEAGVVGVYDGNGVLQKIEKLKRGLQTTIKLKTGTDN